MQRISLDALGRQQLEAACRNPGGRAADTVVGGHEKVLRQTVIAYTAGSGMGEHESPGEGTVYLIKGRIRLLAGDHIWEARTGDLLILPQVRHSLEAIEDSIMLLTVAKVVTAL